MKVIWKYPVEPGRFTISLPVESRFRSVQAQRGKPQMWLEVDPYGPMESITFRCVPTGIEFDVEGLRYLGTFQMADENLVFHLYSEELRPTGDCERE